MAARQNAAHRPATGRDVRQILGDLDAETITAILATKATSADLVQVREWIDADPIVRSQLRHGAAGVVGQICDLLEEVEFENDRER
jgi:hypothetical protein